MVLEVKGHMKCHGTATVGERGQVVLPAELRKKLGIGPGEKLIVLAINHNGFERIIMMKSEAVTKMFSYLFDIEKAVKETDFEKIGKALEKTGIKGLAGPISKGKKKKIEFKIDV